MATKKTTVKKSRKFATKGNIAKIEAEGYLVLKDETATQYNNSIDKLTKQVKESEQVSSSRLKITQDQSKHIVELQGVIKGLRGSLTWYKLVSTLTIAYIVYTVLAPLF